MKTLKRLVPGDGGCLLCTGYLDKDGYARICQMPAHRYMWISANGPIPHGMQINHLCRNRNCVAIDHLYLGTHTQNMRDRHRDGTMRSGNSMATHCKHGHELSGDNLRITHRKRGDERVCLACQARRGAESYGRRLLLVATIAGITRHFQSRPGFA